MLLKKSAKSQEKILQLQVSVSAFRLWNRRLRDFSMKLVFLSRNILIFSIVLASFLGLTILEVPESLTPSLSPVSLILGTTLRPAIFS